VFWLPFFANGKPPSLVWNVCNTTPTPVLTLDLVRQGFLPVVPLTLLSIPSLIAAGLGELIVGLESGCKPPIELSWLPNWNRVPAPTRPLAFGIDALMR
jgi:hypothetical protein